MAASSSAVPTADSAVWRAVAGASIHIPSPNSYVYYFPQGHHEQYGHAVTQNSNMNLGRPFIPCQVLSVGLFYHPLSDQPFAKMLLQPAINIWRQQQKKDAGDNDNGAESDVVSYAKILTPSDANNGGGFSVPRSCADLVFPRLDFAADPPVQNLRIKDARDNAWEFRHIYRGTPRRHLITTGWSKFVNAKCLVAGDSVVFMRKKSTAAPRDHHRELFIGIRRAWKFGGNNSSWQFGEISANSSAAGEALEKAAKGMSFEVLYYPRVGSPDFVVSAEKVEEASRIRWSTGMRVRMEVETEDSTRMASSEGTITATTLPENGPWRGSPWRMLQVTWDEPEIVLNAERVSPWEVEYVPPAASHLYYSEFPPAKKFKATLDDHGEQRDHEEPEEFRFPTTMTELITSRSISGHGDIYHSCDSIHNHSDYQTTFTQLLTNNSCIEPAETNNTVSRIMHQRLSGNFSHGNVHDHQGSSNVGVGSFRLFGKTIRTSDETGGLEKTE